MQLPVQITFRNVDPSEAVATRIREEAAKLDTFFDSITSCRVIVEAPHRHHKWGDLFHIRIDLGVPGTELVVSHEPSPGAVRSGSQEAALKKNLETHPGHRDVYVAIHDAFKSARRQLQSYVRRLRGEVKSHERTAPPRPG